MGESTRPPVRTVQRVLIVGALVGIILGCVVGVGLSYLYVLQNPPVYAGGAYPDELTQAYQDHYMAMVVDSYLINQQADVAQDRLKRLSPQQKIRMLGERSAAYVAAGRGVEAQLINNLAATLKSAEGWSEDTVKSVIGDLAVKYQDDPARAQAISSFSAQLLEGQVPELTPQPGEAAPTEPAQAEAPVAEPVQPIAGLPWRWGLACCLGLLVAGIVIYFVGRRRFEARKAPTKQKVVWEGEGAPPLKQWTGTYELGDDTYDEFFTIETDDGDFLGESGMGILESIPGTSPKQVVAFDVGLFDKTDITTLSRVVMTESAYNDEAMRSKIEVNPQAEPVVAEPGKEFSFETSALRIEAKIEDMEVAEGEEGQSYFTRLSVSMNLFLKEGADIKKGEMAIPEEYQ